MRQIEGAMTGLRVVRKWRLGFLLLALLASACQSQCRIIGDASVFDVVIADATAERIEVAMRGAMWGTQQLTLRPREEQRARHSWLYPDSDSDVVTVKAATSSGAAIFCEQYRYRDLQNLSFYILIEQNVLAC